MLVKLKVVKFISLIIYKEIIKDLVDIVVDIINVFIMYEFVF